jgi:hypothetical protein
LGFARAINMIEYPWYGVVTGDAIEQGDILRRCVVYLPPTDLAVSSSVPDGATAEFRRVEQDLIVLSHTCDLVQGREKVSDALLCGLWPCDAIGGHLAEPQGKEDARRGNLPAFHMLARCVIPGYESDVAVVAFRRVYSLPVDYVREFAASAGNRVRLLPPYREHLAQAFARFFMRVGLPVDIPPFKS